MNDVKVRIPCEDERIVAHATPTMTGGWSYR